MPSQSDASRCKALDLNRSFEGVLRRVAVRMDLMIERDEGADAAM